ncbi:sugar ABC transporter ATP-binding protein [Sediminispirochaeta smaragdinae]|uniref:ABC transporter related protein n=1 Tax=Sediminispirochaeta smaragdinae (strain DSM 11293 / JCM 15392 / SEBR 4228) TaxID=573413 RepID=E1RA82_SEDSS|nr:sugar ABC transporter ATP-binding protein [Sediminispirochaeta smaragdinae]ADK79373.1 ABC transporter related protein [Sediminispirochaeta smaragdinae DSM 11293]
METLFLSMKQITKVYAGVRALDGVDFSIARGEIHCLAGTNGSGKSTLVKIISGVVAPEAGAEIIMDGELLDQHTSRTAISHGVEVIYQDLSLFPNLTVAENIAVSSNIAQRRYLMDWKRAETTATKAMNRIGISIPLDARVGELSMADQQLVAICRALTGDVRLLIMDEPTTALTKKEIDALLRVVIELKNKGIASLFISHKLNEVMQIAERVTVLRDGTLIGTYDGKTIDDKKLEFLMTGETSVYEPYHVSPDRNGKPILRLENFSRNHSFCNVSLEVYSGEIVGITGLLGSGRSELALSIFGFHPADSGRMEMNGEEVSIDSVETAKHHGIAYVPEDRIHQGLVMDQSVSRNLVATVIDRLQGKTSLIDTKKLHETVAYWVETLKIKVPSLDAPVKTLSGGNQQRIVLGKWIATEPRLFILDNPTVGIDVSAKSSIHKTIKKLAREGMGVIIISDEISEVLNNCSRILVMHKGRIIGSFDTTEASEEEIQAFIESQSI